MDDYRSAFDPDFHLGKLSRPALARLGREYMLYGHIRDRALMPAVAMTHGMAAQEAVAIDEWMGASPLYTRRMRRAMRIDGDNVAAIMKSLQLDVGFAHKLMDVGYNVETDDVGTFWLKSCGALLDVEPFGTDAVVSMCHHMEDPTFDATAYAINPRARMRPIHRPPREPADRMPHCRWEIRIDPSHAMATQPAITAEVARSTLAELEISSSGLEDDGGGGMNDYSGPFDPDFRLDKLSRRALVVVCKEFLVQNQLITRAAAIALGERFGEEAAREMVRAQWVGSAPLATRRLRAATGIEGDGASAVLKTLQLHPLLPQGYVRMGFELGDERHARFWIEDCPALHDVEPRGYFSLLEDPDCPGLNAMVQAVNARARCTLIPGSDRPAWALEIDPDGQPASSPKESAYVEACSVATIELEDDRS